MGKRIYNLGENTQVDENAYIVVDKEGLPSAQKIQLSKLEELYNTNYIPLWKPNTEYKVGDIVKYIGEIDGIEDPIVEFLYCSKEHTSVDMFDMHKNIWNIIYSSGAICSQFTQNIIAYDIPTDNGTTSKEITGKDIYDIMEALRDYYPAGRTIEETSCEIFNDYENNFASGDYTHSEGHQNVILHQMKLSQEEITYVKYENGILTVFAENNYFDNVDTQYFYIEHETNKVQVDMVKVSGMTKNINDDNSYNWSFNIEVPLSILELPDSDDGKVKIYAIVIQDEDGEYSHVEGWANISNGRAGHAEGWHNKVIDNYGHAEGAHSIAGYGAHAEGSETKATAKNAHAEGRQTTASGQTAHAEGLKTVAEGESSHAEGHGSKSLGMRSHAEGDCSEASGTVSHAEGASTVASGNKSHAEGTSSKAINYNAHAEGEETTASGHSSHAEGYKTTASGDYSHSEGNTTTASGTCSHSEGNGTIAEGGYSHSEGFNTHAKHSYSHAEGHGAKATGSKSHAEGDVTEASGDASHAEGSGTIASGHKSHAEGTSSKATAYHSHAEGNQTTASGTASHAEGDSTTASGEYSHSEGRGTTASGTCQHVEGKYNKLDNTKAHIVGNGTASNLSNAYTLDWDGNGWYAGTVETSAIILRSSTSGSTKRFKITVDDTGTLKTEEIIDNV